jgi:cation diffusion facilitator CzcD-associated flavoprotein CzcO/acetyl esterase/lipase
MQDKDTTVTRAPAQTSVDAVVVGAGFGGLYMVHRLREAGLSVQGIEAGGDVGGTWYWNRYPGARCDIQSFDYSYTFDPELEKTWTWSEKYATQPEILKYLGFVADRYDLRRDIRFNTKALGATWDEGAERWTITTDNGPALSCRFYIMATGCLSSPKPPEIDGLKDFKGDVYFTGRWPHEKVDFTGKKVAVIGTGSSAIQAIPLIAQEAAHLTVFQRTPNFAFPAFNGPVTSERVKTLAANRDAYRQAARLSMAGVPLPMQMVPSWAMSEADRRARFEEIWRNGDLVEMLTQLWADQGDLDGNALVCELLREKIRATVKDPHTAALLSPTDYPFGAKRPCLATNYFETYNRPNVTLVDLHEEPILSFSANGVKTARREVPIDAVVFATGFDAMTGAILAVHPITGRNGVTIQDAWQDGPQSYLGLTVAGLPNFFTITGPGSPSVLSNMAVSIEQHVDWVVDRIIEMREAGFTTIEATKTAQDGWARHCRDAAQMTLHRHANTWYTGANVPGKAQGVMPYTGGVGPYRTICDEVAARGLIGFRLKGPKGEQCNDGEVVRLQPDVRLVLGMLAQMGLPPIESMGPAGARAFLQQMNAARAPGRPVGAVEDGMLQGADGAALPYKLYRPAGAGPHPIVVYFHGGGWVIGDEASDDPLCRDLCRRASMIVVSVGYRHAPEHRFPTAAEDAYAATRWVGAHARDLGGDGRLIVAGWSAGGNLAAVTAQLACDRAGPKLSGQLLICPVTDSDFTRPSYKENADGYFLTRSLMDWFWANYCDPANRKDPRVAPLHGKLEGLPPAFVATAEFDPLRDEGRAYAEALAKAGVSVERFDGPGQFHSSYAMVDVVVTATPAREQMAAALRRFAGLPTQTDNRQSNAAVGG